MSALRHSVSETILQRLIMYLPCLGLALYTIASEIRIDYVCHDFIIFIFLQKGILIKRRGFHIKGLSLSSHHDDGTKHLPTKAMTCFRQLLTTLDSGCYGCFLIGRFCVSRWCQPGVETSQLDKIQALQSSVSSFHKVKCYFSFPYLFSTSPP